MVIFYFESFFVILFPISSMFYFLGIEFYNFSLYYNLNHEFEKLIRINILFLSYFFL